MLKPTLINLDLIGKLMFKIFILISYFLLSSGISAQNNDPSDKELDRIRKALIEDRYKIRKLLDNSLFKMKDLFDQFSNTDDFDSFGDLFGKFEESLLGGTRSGKWQESTGKRVLVLDIPIKKDTPLDIKITKGIITIKSKIIKKEEFIDQQGNRAVHQSSRVIHEQYHVPLDCVEKSAEIENKNKQIHISFKLKSSLNKKKIKKKDDEKKPVDSIGGKII